MASSGYMAHAHWPTQRAGRENGDALHGSGDLKHNSHPNKIIRLIENNNKTKIMTSYSKDTFKTFPLIASGAVWKSKFCHCVVSVDRFQNQIRFNIKYTNVT